MVEAWKIVEPETPFVDGWHIKLICDCLEGVRRGEVDDLLVNIPPGAMKSLLCCVFFPCWVWTTSPETRWMFASYSAMLSTRDSLKRRTIMDSDWYQKNWAAKVTFKKDQNQKTQYENTASGWMFATSVGGAGLGSHPDYIIADDPHSTEQAESNDRRQHALDWWSGTIASRGVARGVKKIVIMQRLHEEDLSGYWLEHGNPMHVCLPMEFEVGRMTDTPYGGDPRKEPGELLWPQLMSADKVQKLKEMGPLKAAGQLQQRPAPREGSMFKLEWLSNLVDGHPAECTFVRYWDKAGTQDGGDYTVGLLMGRHEGLFYVIDVVRGQWSSGGRNAIIKATADADRTRYGHVQVWVEQEPGSGGKESAEITMRELSAYAIRSERVTGSKEDRADPFAAQCEFGNLRIVKGDWNGDYIAEMIHFPTGKHDDQVDASSGAYNKLHLGASRGINLDEMMIVTGQQERDYLRLKNKKKVRSIGPAIKPRHWADED